jgi:hypothetical protein
VDHYLFLFIVPETKIGIAHLWKESLASVFDEYLMDFGVGTDGDSEPRIEQMPTRWHMFMKLLPEESGEVHMTVTEDQLPHNVLFTFTKWSPKYDPIEIVKAVGLKYIHEFGVHVEVETYQPSSS